VGRVCRCTVRFSDRRGFEHSTDVRAASVYGATCRAWSVFKSEEGTEEESFKTKEFVVEVIKSRKFFTWSWRSCSRGSNAGGVGVGTRRGSGG